MTMKIFNKNAIDLLKDVTKQRKWHQGKIEWRKAAITKTNLNRGKLSYEKASEILILLGYEKIREEEWAKITKTYDEE